MYGFQCNLLERYFKDRRIDAMTTEDLKQYLGEAAEYLKLSSLGHRVRFIKSLFKWTHEEGFILKNPAAKLKEPKLGKRIPKFLSEHEIEHLREGVIHQWRKPCLNFLFH